MIQDSLDSFSPVSQTQLFPLITLSMAEGVSVRKSPTKEEMDDVRCRLKMHMNYLSVIENHFIDLAHPRFSFLKIVDSNARYSCCFDEALCKIQVNSNDVTARKEQQCCLTFKQLFNVKLLNYLIHTKDTETVSNKQFLALEKLADFLHYETDHADKLWRTSQTRELKEVNWAKVICAHLVSQLAVEKNVTLDDEYAESSSKHCPCNCGTELVFQDNSMGHEDVWHGCVDILVGRSAVVTTSVGGDTDGGALTDSSDSGDVTSVKFDQVIAQSIVFSLTQRDRDIAPTLLITKTDMRVYIYEKKHDLLLETYPIRIFDGTRLDPVFVLSLWFTLNYHFFTDDKIFMELKPDDVRFLYHADFFKDMPERKQFIYKEDLRLTGCRRTETHTELYDTIELPLFPNLPCVETNVEQ